MSVRLYWREGVAWLSIHHKRERVRFSLQTKDRATAKAARKEYERRIACGEPVFGDRRGSITFRSYALDEGGWLERKANTRRASTVAGYRTAIREAIPVIGKMPLVDVTRLDAKRVARAFARGGHGTRSVQTVMRLLAYLQSLFSDAAEDHLGARGERLIVANPFERKSRLVDGLLPEREELGLDGLENVPDPYTTDETDRILEAAQGDLADYGKILIALDAGLRRSEVLGLRFDDLDLKGAWGQVNRRLSRGKLGEPKSGASRRRFPITDRVIATVRSLRSEQMRTGLRRGRNEPPDVLFPPRKRQTQGSGFEDEKRFGQRFGRVLDGAKVERRAQPFHRLRHTYVSRLLAAGVEPYLVSKWAGHRSTEFTERIYARWVPGDDHREKINRVVRKATTQSVTIPTQSEKRK